MLKRTFALVLICIITLAVTVGGTWSYFADVQNSQHNQISAQPLTILAGTMDPNDPYGYNIVYTTNLTRCFNSLKLKPTQSTKECTIYLMNDSPLNISNTVLDFNFQYAESDGSGNSVNVTAQQSAQAILVTVMDLDRSIDFLQTSSQYAIRDWNGNSGGTSQRDLDDLVQESNASDSHLKSIAYSLAPGMQGVPFHIQLQLKSRAQLDTIDNYQADGVDITMIFKLSQAH
jgi:predicted ribosomally synthesized peptide with SipW-like signal peptide